MRYVTGFDIFNINIRVIIISNEKALIKLCNFNLTFILDFTLLLYYT